MGGEREAVRPTSCRGAPVVRNHPVRLFPFPGYRIALSTAKHFTERFEGLGNCRV